MKYRGLGVAGFHELHATEWGPRSSKQVVVCAHGYSGNGRDFDYLARDLASRGARVICPDFAGRGQSAWLPAFEYHFGRYLADIASLLAHLEVTEVDWVGTSMGGLIGMALAARRGATLRSLVMNDIGAYLPADALLHISRNLHSEQPFASLRDAEAHVRHTHREWGDISDEQYRHLVTHGTRREADGYHLHFDPQLEIVAKPPPYAPGIYLWDAWYRLHCPVLLLRGEDSQVFPAHVAKTMLDVKPAARLVEFAGCGHAPALMSAEQIEVVREFVLPEPRMMAAVSRGARHDRVQRLHTSRPA
ncbi:MAG TPA: alpha/beta hydrolase [Usitatibacter sp.]|nr:alpha/beta hydrolase [Usitatibacter sp.]